MRVISVDKSVGRRPPKMRKCSKCRNDGRQLSGHESTSRGVSPALYVMGELPTFAKTPQNLSPLSSVDVPRTTTLYYIV
jgi:hypothetical protein